MSRTRKIKKQRQQESREVGAFKALVCNLGGVECHFWFDEHGELCGKGPEEASAIIEAFLYCYGPLLREKAVTDCISRLEPVGPEYLPIKKFAVLDLVLEAEAQGKRGEDIVLPKELIEQRVKKLRELPDLG
jgi:hypothetical protein